MERHRENQKAHAKRKQLFVDFGPVESIWVFGYEEDGWWGVCGFTEKEQARLLAKGVVEDAEGMVKVPMLDRIRHRFLWKRLGVVRAAAQGGWYYGWSYHDAEEMWIHYGEDGPTNSPQAEVLAMEVLDDQGNRVTVVPGPGDVTYYYTVTGRLKARDPG
jgi:hypothetical protein